MGALRHGLTAGLANEPPSASTLLSPAQAPPAVYQGELGFSSWANSPVLSMYFRWSAQFADQAGTSVIAAGIPFAARSAFSAAIACVAVAAAALGTQANATRTSPLRRRSRMTPRRSSATAGPDWSPERVLRLDAVDDSGAPVGHEQSAAAVNRGREGVVEARREDRNPARVATPVELDAHDSAAEAIRVVLAPFGDVEVAPPEGQTVCGGVRCEIR